MKIRVTLLFLVSFLSFSGFAQKLSKDQVAAKKVVVDFFKWYRNNSEKISSFQLYKGRKTKDLPPYVIDWKAVERYFAYIRKSVPYFGEAFIKSETQNFKEIQKSFNQYPDSEIAPGFDYDRYTGGQESPEYMVDYLLSKQTKITVKVSGNIAKVFFESRDEQSQGAQYVVECRKEKGLWKVAKNIEMIE